MSDKQTLLERFNLRCPNGTHFADIDNNEIRRAIAIAQAVEDWLGERVQMTSMSERKTLLAVMRRADELLRGEK